jgi:hypothetical protein
MSQLRFTLLLSSSVYLLGLIGSLPDPFASPIWPATGFQIAMFFLYGHRAIWAMTPGILAIQLQLGLQGGMFLEAATYFAIVSWSAMYTEAFLAKYLTRTQGSDLNNQSVYLRFALIGAPIGTLSSAIQGVSVLNYYGAYPSGIEWYIPYLVWWTGNLVGAYTLVPLLLLKKESVVKIKDNFYTFSSYLLISLSIVTLIAINPNEYFQNFLYLSIIIFLYFLVKLQNYQILVLTISISTLIFIALQVNYLVVLNVGQNVYHLFVLEAVLALILSMSVIFYYQVNANKILANQVLLHNQEFQKKVKERTKELESALDEISQLKEKEKEGIYHATAYGAQHILNNLLNQLMLVKIEMDRDPNFNKEVLDKFKRMTKQAQDLVKNLSSVEIIDEGSIKESIYPRRFLQLIYVSKATKEMTKEDLTNLLEQSRERNKKLNVTGMLLYSGLSFIQVLEGASNDVEDIYESIIKDDRNTDNYIVQKKGIDEREFPNWTMGFRDLTEEDIRNIEGLSDFLEREKDLSEIKLSHARLLLSQFKDLN